MSKKSTRLSRPWFFGLLSVYVIYKLFVVLTVDPEAIDYHASSSSLFKAVDTGMFIGLIVAVRGRLHDQDRTGWWCLLAVAGLLMLSIAPFLSMFASTPGGQADADQLSALLYGLSMLALAPIAYLMTRPGTPGANRFGPPTRSRSTPPVPVIMPEPARGPTPAPSMSQTDALEALEKLAELKGRSLLTEAEFDQQKASILRRM